MPLVSQEAKEVVVVLAKFPAYPTAAASENCHPTFDLERSHLVVQVPDVDQVLAGHDQSGFDMVPPADLE